MTAETAQARVLKQLPVVKRLITYLRPAVQRATRSDILIIPLSIVNDILRSTPCLYENELSSLVQILGEPPIRKHCSRLDVVSFQCILFLFLLAPACIERENGLYLLLDSMRDLSDILHQNLSQEIILAANQRKELLCQKVYVQLVQCFTRANSEAPRRWSGQFILELIHGFDRNKHHLISMLDGVRGILHVLFKDDDACLRVIAATIMKELAMSQSKLPAPSLIDSRIELLKKCPGFLLPDRGGQWIKGIGAAITAAGESFQGAFYALAISIDGLVESIDAADGFIFTLSHSSLTVLTMFDCRFNFIDISWNSIESVKAEGNNMNIYLECDGYYITNGIKQRSKNILIEMEEPDYVDAAIKIVKHMKAPGLTHENKDKIALYKGPKDGAVAVIAFEDCGGVSEQYGPSVVHESNHTSSDDDGGMALWKENHRLPSSAIIELPTSEEVLCASQLFLGSSKPANSQERHTRLSERHTLNQEPYLMEKSAIGCIDTESPPHEASPKLSSLVNPLDQTPQHVSLQAKEEEATVPQTSPDLSNPSNPSTSPCPKVEVGGVDRAAGELSDLPNLAMQALLLQPQHSNSNPQTTRRTTTNTTYIEESPCYRATPVAKEATILVPNSQLADNPTTTMADSGSYKSPQGSSSKPRSESNSINNSHLKRPVHKLCSLSTKKADFDWDEDLRVDTEKPRPQAPVPESSKNPKGKAGNGELGSTSKGKKKPHSKTKQNIKTLKLTPQTGDTSAKQNKRPSRQVTKTLTSGRQPRSAAEAANKKMALATERENATYDLDDPIESSYPGSTSLEELADHIQIENNSMINSIQKPQKRCSTTIEMESDKASSEPSGGVSIYFGKDMVLKKKSLGTTTSQPALKQTALSCQSKADKSEVEEESVINLCSDSFLEENDNQKGKNKADQISKVEKLKQAVNCHPGPASSSNISQTVAKKLPTTTECMGSASAEQNTKLSEVLSDLNTGSGSASEKKRTVENASQISKNVSQFMSRNLASAQKSGLSSISHKADPDQSIDQIGPTCRLDKDNPGISARHVENKLAKLAPTKVPPGLEGRYEQRLRRSVKFDLAEDHIQASSMHASSISSDGHTQPYRYTSMANDKHAVHFPMRGEGSSSPLGLADDTTAIASESDEDQDEELISSSILELKKYAPTRTRHIGWQSQTVDENGSPIPRLQKTHNTHDKYNLETSKVSRKQKGRAYINLPCSASFQQHLKEQESATLSSSACNTLINDPKDGAAYRYDREIPSNLDIRLRPGSQYNSRMKATELFYPKAMCHGKLEEPSIPAVLTQNRSFRLMQRLKAHQIKSGLRSVNKKRPLIDVRSSQQFESMDYGGDNVGTEVETNGEGSPPPWRRECPEHVEYRELEGEKQLRKNYRGSRNLLLDTSKRLSQELWESENRLFHSVDIYRVGCSRMIDQLEGIHSEKLDQCENTLRPIKKRFLGMFENFSKRLDNDQSMQKASANISTMTSKDQRKITGKIDAAIDEYSSKLARATNA